MQGASPTRPTFSRKAPASCSNTIRRSISSARWKRRCRVFGIQWHAVPVYRLATATRSPVHSPIRVFDKTPNNKSKTTGRGYHPHSRLRVAERTARGTMERATGNLFATAAADPGGAGEVFTTLFASGAARVERIASNAHASPPGFWYDQRDDEWVVVLRGEATLEFDDGPALTLSAGDWVTIPAHVRHRVA